MNAEVIGHGDPLTYQVIGSLFEVYRELGFGFLEAVYQRAVALSLADQGLAVVSEARIPVSFRGRPVGDYRADLLVEGRLIVEIKAGEGIAPAHRVQLLNYLRATPVEKGLLVNFGQKLTFERFIFTNDRKQVVLRT
jgi:GxxExxY protein